MEHLSQRIQYYTNENNYDTDGSGAGQVYDSSRYPKNLQWVKAFIRVPLGVDDAIYRAGVYRVASDNEILEVLGQSEVTGIITVTGTYRFDFLAEATSATWYPTGWRRADHGFDPACRCRQYGRDGTQAWFGR